jgi:aldehyde:ferredoxin oxidoreductase
MPTHEKRQILMDRRKSELRRLVTVYYEERGWNEKGIPKIETLQKLELWNFLGEETKKRLAELV